MDLLNAYGQRSRREYGVGQRRTLPVLPRGVRSALDAFRRRSASRFAISSTLLIVRDTTGQRQCRLYTHVKSGRTERPCDGKAEKCVVFVDSMSTTSPSHTLLTPSLEPRPHSQ